MDFVAFWNSYNMGCFWLTFFYYARLCRHPLVGCKLDHTEIAQIIQRLGLTASTKTSFSRKINDFVKQGMDKGGKAHVLDYHREEMEALGQYCPEHEKRIGYLDKIHTDKTKSGKCFVSIFYYCVYSNVY